MSPDDLVSIIVPALNEADSLRELYDRTRKVMAGRRPFEFVVVDDGSTDNTLDELRALRQEYPNICVRSHYRNYGKSLALMQAFSAARGEVAVIMDADLQDEPEMIPRFLAKLDEGYDLVNGWRNERRDKTSKVFVSGVFNRLTSRVFKCPTHDINCGFKAIRRNLYKLIELRGDQHRLIPAMAKCKGFKVTEVQIEHAPRRYGTSRYRLLRHRGLIDIVSLMAVNTSLRPFHLFCEAAAACWFLALVALAGWAGIALYAPADSLWTRLVEPLAGLLGTGAFFLGMILPVLGFQFEVTASRIQDAPWRDGLIKEKMEARVGPIAKHADSDDEDDSPARYSRAEVEARRVSLMKEATAA